jgi:two-component system, NarL family, response regulator
MRETIRLIIADDHAVFRDGLKSLMRLEGSIEVVAEVDRASQIETVLQETSCDLLLLDLQMDEWVGDQIKNLSGYTSVLVLTASERVEDAMTALRMGARAIVQKRFAFETLIEAIKTVASGMVWLPTTLQTQLAAQWAAPSVKPLTDRETEIVRCVAIGLRNAEVARQLSISESTVKSHLNNIFQKLALRDRVELTHYAIALGLVGVRRGAS